MRIAITAQAPSMSAPVDPRFGRARYFIVADTDTHEWQAVDNAVNLQAAQGAGIQAGKNVADLNVQALITGHVGPKAFAILQAADVTVYTGASGTAAAALARFQAGELTAVDRADVESHWA